MLARHVVKRAKRSSIFLATPFIRVEPAFTLPIQLSKHPHLAKDLDCQGFRLNTGRIRQNEGPSHDRTRMKGYLSLILHAHLPFVRHPEHPRFLEENWFFEAITETYIPLLRTLEGWSRDGMRAP